MNKKIFYLIFAIIIVFFIVLSAVFLYNKLDSKAFPEENTNENIAEKQIEEKDKLINKKVEVKAGKVYCELMEEAGVAYSEAIEIYEEGKDKYDLSQVRAGRFLDLYFDKSNVLQKLKYKINSEEELIVEKNNQTDISTSSTSTSRPKWNIEVKEIPYEVREALDGGSIETSMYEAAINNGLDDETIIELADAFQWTIDFAMETQKGDSFKLFYEKRYLDGEYVMPGRILAAQYMSGEKKYEIYYYEESEENQGYFNEKGESAQKMFLKAPVSYKYISSGYTQGPRYLAKFKMFTSTHMAIDYAAAIGTPIRSVGDGVITSAGWSSVGYGYITAIKHNSTYTTRYAHQSKIIVSPGQKVKQGQIIGYVGSTGLSTGPHLHFEMIKNGIKINPLNEKLPASKSISEENMENFFNFIKPLQEKLNS
ncbi:M23 family metallopeptidase [bacterium]|nr:M23 family metallopeptidase [bacterium]